MKIDYILEGESIQHLYFSTFFTICRLSSWLHPVCLKSNFPKLYRSCLCLLENGMLLDSTYYPKLVWSLVLDLHFSTSFLCNLLCLELYLISFSGFLLDHFLWKYWGQQSQSTNYQCNEKHDGEHVRTRKCTHDLYRIWLLETWLFSFNFQVQNTSWYGELFLDKQHFNSAIILHTHVVQ